MSRIMIAGPAVEPVTLADAKAHLRLDGSDEDGLVQGLVAAARATVEGATRLLLIEQTWRLTLDAWPPWRVVLIPLAPILAVAALRVAPPSGSPVTVGGALYRLDRSRDPVRLVLDAGVPDPGVAAGGIEIDLLCGFGPAPADVPAPLRLAIRRLVARDFAQRGDAAAPGSGLPADVRTLLAPFARPRLAP